MDVYFVKLFNKLNRMFSVSVLQINFYPGLAKDFKKNNNYFHS